MNDIQLEKGVQFLGIRPEEGPVFFGFTDRVAPVPVFFASGFDFFSAGAVFLMLSGQACF